MLDGRCEKSASTFRAGPTSPARWRDSACSATRPDQPWSCPENCLTYERRFVDVGWSHGSLVDRPVEAAPPDVPIEERRELLDSASEIVNAVAPELIEERRREIEELDEEAQRRAGSSGSASRR